MQPHGDRIRMGIPDSTALRLCCQLNADVFRLVPVLFHAAVAHVPGKGDDEVSKAALAQLFTGPARPRTDRTGPIPAPDPFRALRIRVKVDRAEEKRTETVTEALMANALAYRAAGSCARAAARITNAGWSIPNATIVRSPARDYRIVVPGMR